MKELDCISVYEDAAFYDAEFSERSHEIPFYVERATHAAGPVLELACGTGRLTLFIAAAGVPIVGVDVVPSMLDRAREKALARGLHVEWHLADIRELHLRRTFRLAFIATNALQHLHDAASLGAFFGRAREHLVPGGYLIVDVFNPSVSKLSRTLDARHQHKPGLEIGMTVLYRPVGLEELRLVYDADMRAFPPRLPEQPIFYPVTSEGYARQIAREWNTTSGTRAGFVTRFTVDSAYAARFERKIVGSREHEELWVPGEELEEFNRHIDGQVIVIGAYFGQGYCGLVPEHGALRGQSALEQFITLAGALPHGEVEVGVETVADHRAVFLNFFFWEQTDLSSNGFPPAAKHRVLEHLREAWASGPRATIPLGLRRDSADL